ncbi:MAG: diacylglycerol kinase family lipid kinase [Chloroflexota bacterium]
MGAKTLIAVGGDGTVHEVVNGFKEGEEVRDDVRLGIVPAGTGMDFARNIGMSRGVATAVRHLIQGSERRIDVGMCQSDRIRVFVNFAETGLGASVVAREAAFGPGWPGRISYLMAAIAAAMSEENPWARVCVDGDRVYEGPLVSVVVANGRYFGGGMKIAPQASVCDGIFDILILGDFSKAELIGQVWKIYPGFHVAHRKVLSVRGSRVTILSSPGTRLDLDGELGSEGPYSFRVLPQALRVLANP